MELRLDQRQSLSASWLLRLVREAGYDVPQTSLSTAPFIIGRPDGFHITVTPQNNSPWITAVSSDQGRQDEIDELVRRGGELTSGALASEADFGGHVWYTCTLGGEQPNLADPMFFSRMQEMLSTQIRIVNEWRRLGTDVLLNFREDVPDGGVQDENILFPPRPIVDVYVAVAGPIDGPFTRPIAHRAMELVAAICTFALGRPVNLPPTVWPAQDEMLAELETRRADTTILTLARHGMPLDMFHLVAVGDMDSWARLQGALLSYDAAIRQQREQVAVILYVVAAECLTNPFQPWKTERLTTRFIKFFDELMPGELDSMVQHGNFEQAFGIVRGSKSPKTLRRLMLDSLYGFRSDPVHEGLAMAYEGFAFSGAAGQRRMFASWFAQWAILRYLESPRTTLIGHPATATATGAEGLTPG
ncbi:hypothetical protein [Mycobacterium sp.]|uniref:hypothetical protein n=2 Tax=Mycobacterium sp. TaxID=1785 RepID=UPI003F98081B